MDKDMYAHYVAVLADQQASREDLLVQVKLVETTIAALKVKLNAYEAENAEAREVQKPLAFPTPVPQGAPAQTLFAGISVRWAVLHLMAEHATGPMRSSEIADALQAGGVRSSGLNFAANVSAVISEMRKKDKPELSADDGRFEITDHGREVWDGIKHTRQYRYRRGVVAAAVAAVAVPEAQAAQS